MNDPDRAAEQIHEASLALLADPGVRIEHAAIRNLLLRYGATAGNDADVVRMPRELIDESLAQCPRAVVLTGRKGRSTTLTAATPPVYWSCPGMNMHHHGQRRPFLAADMAATARLLERLDHAQAVFGMSLDDVPPAARDVAGLNIMARNCSKHIRVLCFSPQGAARLVEMKDVAPSGAWFSVGFTAHGPLRWTELALEIFRATAGHGIPASVNGEPMAGVSGPVTIAGSAAVGNAEILAGIVINQLLEPGRPIIYNLGIAHIFDMRAAVAVTGGPENHLFAGLSAKMGRFYNLPSASWVSTESPFPDAQAGLEKMFGFASHAFAGVSSIWGMGQLESELTFCPAQAVIDNEMISYAARFARGCPVNTETLALAVTRDVGAGGSFLEHEHTLEHFRSEFFMPEVLFRGRWAPAPGGSGPAAPARLDARAEEIADKLMAEPVDHGLDDHQLRELDKLANSLIHSA